MTDFTPKASQNDRPKKIRVGHAGTLDPFATGLLIVAIGREETKKLDEFKKLPKTYVATLRLGATSDTGDSTGTITTLQSDNPPASSTMARQNNLTIQQFNNKQFIQSNPAQGGSAKPNLTRLTNETNVIVPPNINTVEIILNQFLGKQLQTPPMFSAKKINGKRLYTLARQGKEIKRAPSEIEIYSIKLLDYTWPLLKIEIKCSAGTYIRTLAQDIGEKLGVGAYCEELARTAIGKYSLTEAQNISKNDEKSAKNDH